MILVGGPHQVNVRVLSTTGAIEADRLHVQHLQLFGNAQVIWNAKP